MESTSGSRFIDLFEQINVIAKNQLQGTILVVMSVLAYVNYMSTLKASELFALIVAEPLKKLKSPYLLAGLTIVFGACLKLVIPSAISMQSLLLATLYPVLLAVGVSKATAATALLLAGTIVWGPAESLTYMAFSVAGIDDVPVAQFFVSHEILSVLLMFVFMVPVFILTSKKFDKKESIENTEEAQISEEKTPESLGIPKYYAIFPLLPLLFVIVFSELVVGSVVISVVAANFLSLFIVTVINMIHTKNIKQSFNETQAFYQGMANAIAIVGALQIAGNVFSSALNKIGGMSMLIELVSNGGAPWQVLVLVGVILAAVMIAATGSIAGNMTLFAALFRNISDITGAEILPLMNVLLRGCGLGSGMAPVSGQMVLISGTTKQSIPSLLKRMFLPLCAGLVGLFVATFVFGL